MRSSLRSVLLLGSAIAIVSASSAYADDPLIPEGAERPKMGKELILPPIINEAPPGSAIVLPPPGQEHLLGKRPDGSFASTEKTEARAEEQPVAEAPAEASSEPVAEPKSEPGKKPRKRKDRAQAVAEAAPEPKAAPKPAAVASVPDEKPLYAGLKPTGVPEQENVVAEDGKAEAAKISETNVRMGDLAKPAMGGPELAGPPKPSDGMAKPVEPIRDGDTLSPSQEKALAKVEDKVEPSVVLNPGRMAKPKDDTKAPAADVKAEEPAPAKAPAIERFEIAQATAAPMPVTPMKASNAATPDWDVELSGGVGFGRVETAQQGFFGRIAAPVGGSGSFIGNVGPGTPVAANAFRSDDEDYVVTYEVAAKINLEGLVDPLGGGDIVTPYAKVGVRGHDAEFGSQHAGFAAGPGEAIFVPGVSGGGEGGGEGGYSGNTAFSSVANIRHRGKQKLIRALVEYGQTWHGSSGIDVTGFAQIAHTRRDSTHRLTFTGNGLLNPGGDPTASYNGVQDTGVDSNTTSFGLGAAVSVPLSSDKRLKADATVQGSYDITTAKGRDALRIVNAGTGGLTGASSNALRTTEESFGYGAGVGISYEIARGIGVRLGAEYTSQDSVPVVVRDGANPSRLELEREDVLIGTLTATFKL